MFQRSASIRIVHSLMALSGLPFLSGCAYDGYTSPFYLFEQKYWRIEEQVEPDGKWETNWMIWFETEEQCLAELEEGQRCRLTRM